MSPEKVTAEKTTNGMQMRNSRVSLSRAKLTMLTSSMKLKVPMATNRACRRRKPTRASSPACNASAAR